MKHMKHILSIMTASVLLFSCERHIDINPDGPDRMLVMNAMISSSDTVHQAFFYVSGKGSAEVDRNMDVDLKVYVNGNLVSESSGTAEYGKGVDFHAAVSEGDMIRLSASSGDLKAEGEVRAARSVPFEIIDTSLVQRPGKEDYTRCVVKVNDPGGERNFYMFEALQSTFYTLRDEPYSGPMKQGDTVEVSLRALDIDCRNEPLLNRNVSADFDSESFYRQFCLFTDETFEGGSYTFNLLLPRIRTFEAGHGALHGVYVVDTRRSLSLRLLSFDRQTYNYISSWLLNESDLDGSLFVDPVPYPDNVGGGGIGFITAMGGTDVIVQR